MQANFGAAGILPPIQRKDSSNSIGLVFNDHKRFTRVHGYMGCLSNRRPLKETIMAIPVVRDGIERY